MMKKSRMEDFYLLLYIIILYMYIIYIPLTVQSAVTVHMQRREEE